MFGIMVFPRIIMMVISSGAGLATLVQYRQHIPYPHYMYKLVFYFAKLDPM